MENNSLDVSAQEFEALLNKSNELVLQQFEGLEEQQAYHYFEQEEVEGWFKEDLPLQGMNHFDLLEEVRKKVLSTATNNLGPHMYAYVMAGGNQLSTIAETLVSTVNQNTTKWHLAPAMSEIEKRVIQWTATMMDFTEEAGGVMVSGGSAANLTGLTVARNIFFEKEDIRAKGLFNQAPFIVYASDQVHSCIDKSVQILGIGTNQLRKIQTDEEFKIDTKALILQIEKDLAAGFRPFCIVGNAGTVNTGAVDDLVALSDISKKYGMWFHIDGAYGALASSLEELKEVYTGINRADSLALDFHKWLYQPFEAGCLLVRSWDKLRRTYFKRADYLDTALEKGGNRLEFNEHCFQLSRNAKAFKVWMSLKAYGFDRIKAMIRKDIALTHYLASKINESTDFELMASSHLAVLCFRYTGSITAEEEIIAINHSLIPALEKDGRVFITGTKLNGQFVLRACLINHRKTEATTDYLLQVIREVGSEVYKKLSSLQL